MKKRIKRDRVSEGQMAKVVRKILLTLPKYKATYAELFEMVPRHVRLSTADRAQSESRPGEARWQQIVRNIVTHNREGFARAPDGVRLLGVKARKQAAEERVAV